jgi:hypothetical protein
MTVIATHTSPDWDAIGAFWSLDRYYFGSGAQPVFVNTGKPDPDVIARATAVVDTGRVHDPLRLRFDHHHDGALPCATALVAEFLDSRGMFPAYLKPLVDLIHAGDTAGELARQSAETGIHAMLGAYKRLPDKTDEDVMAWGCEQLDLLAASLRHRAEAKARLVSCMIYRSGDNQVVGIVGGDAAVTNAAGEIYGSRLVVFVNEQALPDGIITFAAGVTRLGGAEVTEPNVGDIVARVLETTQDAAMAEELRRWFIHPQGFFAGRGTGKAPSTEPLLVQPLRLCAAIDAAWKR